MKDVGQRIRSLRKAKRMPLRELARLSGLSISLLSQAERGISQLRVVSLFAVSEALGVAPGDLLGTAPSHNLVEPKENYGVIVTKAEACPLVEIPGWPVLYRWLSGPSSPFSAEMCIAQITENTSTTPTRHAGEELGYVLSGRAELTVGDRVFPLSAGDSFQLRAGELHGITTGDQKVEVLFFQTVKYTMWSALPTERGRVRSRAKGGEERRQSEQSSRGMGMRAESSVRDRRSPRRQRGAV